MEQRTRCSSLSSRHAAAFMPQQPHRDPVQPDVPYPPKFAKRSDKRAGKVVIARSKLGSAPRAHQRQGAIPTVPSALDLPLVEDLLPKMHLVRDILACTCLTRRTRELTQMNMIRTCLGGRLCSTRPRPRPSLPNPAEKRRLSAPQMTKTDMVLPRIWMCQSKIRQARGRMKESSFQHEMHVA